MELLLYVYQETIYKLVHLERVEGSEVEGHEGEPDDARRVHGEADTLGLVKVLRNLACLYGVNGASRNELQ